MKSEEREISLPLLWAVFHETRDLSALLFTCKYLLECPPWTGMLFVLVPGSKS